MRELSSALIAAGHAAVGRPIGKAEIVNHPFMLGSPLQFTQFADMTGTGPRDAVALANGSIVIIHATDGYKLITNPETASQWTASWTAYPVTGKPSNFDALAIAPSGASVQIFARNSSTGACSVTASSDSGATFGSWTSIGTYTEANTNVVGCARYNGLFLRHYSATEGVAFSAFVYHSSAWNLYSRKTGLVDPSPSGSRVGVVQDGNKDVLYFSARSPDASRTNVAVFYVEHVNGAFGQPREAIAFLTQEYMHDDTLKSVSKLGNRDVLLSRTLRAGAESTELILRWIDHFNQYVAQYWLQVATCDTSESWTATYGVLTSETGIHKEGNRGVKITSALDGGLYKAEASLTKSMDLSADGRFGDEDYVCMPIYVDYIEGPVGSADIKFMSGSDYYYGAASLAVGWNFARIQKQSFSASGSPSWSNITAIRVYTDWTETGHYMIIDNWRIVKKDPQGANPNTTGDAWDFSPNNGEWSIFYDGLWASAYGLLCMDSPASVEKSAVRAQALPSQMYLYISTVQAKRDNGEVGVWFDNTDITTGSEDGYAFILDTTNNNAKLYKYVAGTRTQLGSTYSITVDPDIQYFVAVSKVGATMRCYVSTAINTLYTTAAVEVTDDTYTGGRVGFISIGTLGMFSDVDLYVYDDFGLANVMAPAFIDGRRVGDQIIYDSNPPREKFVGTRYSFSVDDVDGIIYRADRAIEAVEYTVSDDVLSTQLTYPHESAASAQATLYNGDGRYNDHASLARGNGIRHSIGYHTSSGVEYANMGLYRINRVREDFTPDGLGLAVDAIDGDWLLKNWKSQAAHLIQSQNRLFLHFGYADDQALLVNVLDTRFRDDISGSELANDAVTEAMALAGVQHSGVVVEAAVRTLSSVDAYGGVALSMDDDGLNGYLVVIDWSTDLIRFLKRTAGSNASLGTVAFTAPHGSYTWLRVLQSHNSLYVWTSPDSITYTYRGTVTDSSSSYLFGHAGIYGYKITSNIAFGRFNMYSLVKDTTTDEAMRQVGLKAGILDFVSEYAFYDDFTAGSVDTTKWRTSEGTIDNVSISGGELVISESGATSGEMNSQLYRTNLVMDFTARTAAGGYIQVMYRMDTAFSNGYLVQIYPGAAGTCAVIFYKRVAGTWYNLYYYFPRVDIPAGVSNDYRLSVNGKYVSLWMGGYLLLTAKDETKVADGYFGIRASNTTPTYFDNFKCYYLDGTLDSLAINVGESGERVCRGLAQMRGATFYVEGDAVMKIGSASPASGKADVWGTQSPLTFEDQLFQAQVSEDDQDWVTHLRAIGKDGLSLDYYDKSDTGLDQMGYRFDVLNLSSVTELNDLRQAAALEIAKRKTSVVQRSFVGQAQLALQRGDRIEVKVYNVPGYAAYGYRVDDDFVVRSLALNYQARPEPELSLNMEAENSG